MPIRISGRRRGWPGRGFETAAETEMTADVGALLAAVRPDTGVLCLANPGNPTGTRLPRSEVLRLRDGLREDILLILDEAYGEFADGLDAPMFDMAGTGNTVILRTLSKAYGMAGARVGWGVFPTGIATEMRKVLSPSSVSGLAQAGALAAVRDQTYMRETCAMTATLVDHATARLRAAGIKVLPSHTNFVLMAFDTADKARRVANSCQAEGLILRAQAGVGLPHSLRMTLGPRDWVEAAVAIIETEGGA